jgi:hypothetical protein
MLMWDKYQFIECLAAVPEEDEDETRHSFRVERDGLRLELTVFQYAGDIYLDLYRDGVGPSVLQMRLLDCPAARYVTAKGGYECIEFAPAKSHGARYDGREPFPVGIRVAVNPHIRIELF